MLYFGEYFLIKLISNKRDSTSVLVTMYSKSWMFSTKALVLPVCSLLKYDDTLLFKFFALPTYIILPSTFFIK